MRSYALIRSALFTEPTFRSLSVDGKFAFIYVRASHHANMIGLFRLPVAYAAHDLDWSAERTERALSELASVGLIARCAESEWICDLQALDDQPIVNSKQGSHAMKLFRAAPDTAAKRAAGAVLAKFAEHVDRTALAPYLESVAGSSTPASTPLTDAPLMPNRCPIDRASTGDRSGIEAQATPHRFPEPEPELEPEPKPKPESEPVAPDSASPTRPGGELLLAEAGGGDGRSDATRADSVTGPTWRAYATAYWKRYQSEPVRNATTNGQMAKFVERIGREEAPHVAAHFLRSNNRYYVQCGHAVRVLLQDAEKLRTEWVTGRQVTETAARQADRTAGTADALNTYLRSIGANP